MGAEIFGTAQPGQHLLRGFHAAAGAHAVGKAGPMEGNTFKADLDKYLEVTPRAAEKDIPMLY